MSQQIPILDISQFRSLTQKTHFVEALKAGYEEFGFIGISNHGLSSHITGNAYQTFKTFFDLPENIKKKYHQPGTGGARGYTPFGIETAKNSYHSDLKEFWHIGRELPANHPMRHIMRDNIWAEEVQNFKQHTYALFNALDELGSEVLRAIALALEQPENFFAHKTNYGNSVLRAIHYPPIQDSSTPSLRSGEHEDINLITLLIGSEEPGLEILSKKGQWIPVTTIPGVIVCNIGDMLQRLSNHAFPSTTHKVTNPPGEHSKRARYSIPFFLHLNPDVLIKTLTTCIHSNNPNRYPEPILANDYLNQRLREIKLL